jgi:hypothetical protein
MLLAAWPNPFNRSFHVRIHAPQAGPMQLVLHDLLGREVLRHKQKVLVPGAILETHMAMPPGQASGVYFLSLQRDTRTLAIQKLLYLP